MRTILDLLICFLVVLVAFLGGWLWTEDAGAGLRVGLVALALVGSVYGSAVVWSRLKERMLAGLRW